VLTSEVANVVLTYLDVLQGQVLSRTSAVNLVLWFEAQDHGKQLSHRGDKHVHVQIDVITVVSSETISSLPRPAQLSH
jgi:hypothetical protein